MRCFSSYFPRPNATLFVITRPLVHNAMSILVPNRWIFIVKAGRAFSYGRERACRLKRNIPRMIKSDGLLCKVLAYYIDPTVSSTPLGTSTTISWGTANRCRQRYTFGREV